MLIIDKNTWNYWDSYLKLKMKGYLKRGMVVKVLYSGDEVNEF